MVSKREFLNRKLHSLLGVIPVGLFLVQHLIVNHFATRGEEAFNSAVGFMGNLPFLIVLEFGVIYLPLIFHAIYGLYIAYTAKNNTSTLSYFRNWMFRLQRISGVIVLIFIAWHVYETRIQAALGQEVNYQMMYDALASPYMLAFYIVGVVSAIFHFSNGLWSFMVSWGITQSPTSQKISSYIVMIIFILLSVVGIRALLAFSHPGLFT